MLPITFPNGLKKAFTLSYDDGCYDDLRLIEMMEKYGVRGTFNVSSGITRPEGQEPCGSWERLTLSERQAYRRDGVEVAVHGQTHRDFTKISEPELIYEIMGDKHALESEFGCLVRGAAYPYGSFNDLSVERLKNCGIKYCRTVWSDHSMALPSDWLRLRPTAHHNDPELPGIIDSFISGQQPAPDRPSALKMLYIWGHTPEFRRDGNWQMMEDYLGRLAGRDDVWYATNLEICEYALAASALEYSADGHIVHNPTAKTVWLDDRGSAVKVGPDETVEV